MRELQGTETFEFTHINMPEAFSLTNQPRPGADLLPALQASTNGRWMPGKIHDVSLAV